MKALPVLLLAGLPVLLSAGLLGSCAWTDSSAKGLVKVRLLLPEPSRAHSILAQGAEPTWTIRWYDREGTARSIEGCSREAVLELDPDAFTPILAHPEQRSALPFNPGLAPAGAVFPAYVEESLTDASASADYQGGIAALAAEYALVHARGGFEDGRRIASRFNWIRLDGRIRIAKEPSCIDIRRCASEILSGSFTASDCASLKTSRIRIALQDVWPRAGEAVRGAVFYPSNPLAAPFSFAQESLDPGKAAVELELPEGASSYFCESGALTVGVESGRAAAVLFTPYR